MVKTSNIVIAAASLLGFALLISKAKGQPPPPPPSEGALDIIACFSELGTSNTASVTAILMAVGDVTKQVKVTAGNFTDTKQVTLRGGQTDIVTFTVLNVLVDTPYTVEVL